MSEISERVHLASTWVHDATCPGSLPHPALGCVSTPPPTSIAQSLTHLDQAPRDAQGARLILHDAVCRSGDMCRDAPALRDEHARVRFSDQIAALRKFRAQEGGTP